MAALRYGDVGLEERTLLLTERLAALDQVKEWKQLVKMELAQPEYAVDQVQSLQNPLMYLLLEKMGLLGLLKRTVIDLHCDAMQSVAAASKKQAKVAAEDSRLLPGTRSTNGCSLDVVRAARENWERITSDEMLRVAKELGRPLVAPKAAAPSSGAEAAARDDGQIPEAEGAKPAKANKVLAASFLYDGNDLLRSLQAIEPSNRVREPTESATDAWGSIQLQLYSPPFPEYRRLFSELAPGCGQMGLDEHFREALF
ncbi:TBC1 domain family member 19 [Phytophthora cinnamomi]|uniref:TBC1 domain family member 19 n=1 Tax=Phytophthora cinnamomi TaxID=4785 RepID=UPI00355A26DE|nr:TBC1 domain family member 19 [Phytophthora cinnamomi]